MIYFYSVFINGEFLRVHRTEAAAMEHALGLRQCGCGMAYVEQESMTKI